MSDEQKLILLKQINPPEVGDTDEILNAFLQLAAQAILNRLYPFSEEHTSIPDKYAMLQIKIASYLLNKRGAEGQTSHSENGINRGYESADIPASFLNEIVPYCGVM